MVKLSRLDYSFLIIAIISFPLDLIEHFFHGVGDPITVGLIGFFFIIPLYCIFLILTLWKFFLLFFSKSWNIFIDRLSAIFFYIIWLFLPFVDKNYPEWICGNTALVILFVKFLILLSFVYVKKLFYIKIMICLITVIIEIVGKYYDFILYFALMSMLYIFLDKFIIKTHSQNNTIEPKS